MMLYEHEWVAKSVCVCIYIVYVVIKTIRNADKWIIGNGLGMVSGHVSQPMN